MTATVLAGRHPDAMPLFYALDAARVRYVVWKDLYEVAAFAAGDAELDLLVHAAGREAFHRIVSAHGYSEFLNHVSVHEGAVAHYLRFADGRYYHLHVFFSMLTGEHYAKEYCLDALFGPDLYDAPISDGVRALDAKWELTLGLIRTILRSDAHGRAKRAELSRLRSIYEEPLFRRVICVLREEIPISTEEEAVLRRLLEGEDEALRELPTMKRHFERHRRFGRPRAKWISWRVRASNALDRKKGLQNKSLRGRAPTIALVGVDGSGKSSIARSLHEILSRKVSAKLLYVGGNTKTYGLASWLAFLSCSACEVMRKALPRWAVLSDLATVLRALFEVAKCRDRVRRIHRGKRHAARGTIVVYERYPIIGFFDYPWLAGELERGEVAAAPWARGIVERLLRSIDRMLEREGKADLTLLIVATQQQITDRRPVTPDEQRDIVRKLNLMEAFQRTCPQAGIDRIDNSGSVHETTARVLEKVNDQICLCSS